MICQRVWSVCVKVLGTQAMYYIGPLAHVQHVRCSEKWKILVLAMLVSRGGGAYDIIRELFWYTHNLHIYIYRYTHLIRYVCIAVLSSYPFFGCFLDICSFMHFCITFIPLSCERNVCRSPEAQFDRIAHRTGPNFSDDSDVFFVMWV